MHTIFISYIKLKMNQNPKTIILIGSGIMSATLGMLINRLQPNWHIHVFERLDAVALESSDAWNNAGTGHAAFCELNYTQELEDGTIDCTKAFKIDEQFEVSKQFWAYLVEKGIMDKPEDFINNVPHISFVTGEEDVQFLKKRHATMTQNHLFRDMQYSEDPSVLSQWMPLMMHHRDPNEKVAATKMDLGTDVNFGALSRAMFKHFDHQDNTTIYLSHEVHDIERDEITDDWNITVKDLENSEKRTVSAQFVFIGAGGGALYLLEKSDIPEASGYGGFPVSGQWLRCRNEAVIAQHTAKVYGKAAVGTPPMSVPHLDKRVINGKAELLFGPFAGFSTKFLKHGSYMDLFKSLEWDNLIPMIRAGLDNIPLTQYLIQQVRQTPEEKLEALQEFFPDARMEDWTLEIAGQRVQVIKKDENKGGVLEFGTEIVHAADGSIAALLGASPGASTSVSAMLDVLEKCFPNHIKSYDWQTKIKEMIPSYGESLALDEELCMMMRNWTTKELKLDD
jgi:malate dehydrogenase (quinone)